MTLTDEVRSFNRFYTREIGLLERHLPASDLSLPEARVLYELAHAAEGGLTAAEIGRRLRMDKAHLSRIVARLRARRLVQSRASPAHGKHVLLSLTDPGRTAFAAANAGARGQVEAMLLPVGAEGRERLASAMRDIRAVLGDRERREGEPRLRSPAPGDIGWIVHRQTILYHEEYGWDWTFEGLASRILGAFVEGFDPAREEGFVAERQGAIVGSVFLMKGDEPRVARLRLLYVEPSARGLGLGRRLVDTCIARARELGYGRITLWTNDVLVSARRIYEAAGFRLTDEAPHHSFGHDLVGQTWVLDLA
jgi:DNA-binding MarR family transcriptional regulator/N-acetylglutamate synthase-like GNAT family acetyltransferase